MTAAAMIREAATPEHKAAPDRRLMAQRAVVNALRGAVNAAIAAKDDARSETAHAALIVAELRLHRMEGFPVAGAGDDVVERG